MATERELLLALRRGLRVQPPLRAGIPPAGIVLNAGEHVLSVTFTPDDAANYDGSSADVAMTVRKAASDEVRART